MAKKKDEYKPTAGDRNEAYGGYELDKDYEKKPESAKEQFDRVNSGKRKYKKGGKVRGQGCAVRGTKFSGVK